MAGQTDSKFAPMGERPSLALAAKSMAKYYGSIAWISDYLTPE